MATVVEMSLRSVLRACLLVGLPLAVPSAVAGHEGTGPWIDVPKPELRQGASVVVVGDDLEPGDQVSLELLAAGVTYPLGSLTADHQGHFTAEAELPGDLEDGDAYVQVATASGWVASLWVHVGDGSAAAVGEPPAPRAPSRSPAWLDPSLIVLGLFVAGAGLAFGRAAWRSRGVPRS